MNQSVNQGTYNFEYVLWVSLFTQAYKYKIKARERACPTSDFLGIESMHINVSEVLKDVFADTHISKELWTDFIKRGLSPVAQSSRINSGYSTI